MQASLKRPFAAIGGLLAAALVMFGLTVPTVALADTLEVTDGEISLSVDYGTTQFEGSTVIEPVTHTYHANVHYSQNVEPGHQVHITVPDELSITTPIDISGNDAIESAVISGNQLTITFVSNAADIDQGFLDLTYVFATPGANTKKTPVTWKLEAQELSTTLIIPGTDYDPLPLPFTNTVAKGSNNALRDIAQFDDDPVSVTLPDSVFEAGAITYTVVLQISDNGSYSLSDTLDSRLVYDGAGSFTAKLRT